MSQERTPPSETTLPHSSEEASPVLARKKGHPAYRGFKGLFWALVIIPALLILGFWGAMQFIDFNQYKPQIEKTFYEKTGHMLQIEGAMEVSVFPFTVKAHQVSIKNQGGEGAAPMAAIKAVEVELSLWTLFVNRKLDIEGLELDQPVIHLTINEKGVSNWHQLQSLIRQKVHYHSQDAGHYFRFAAYNEDTSNEEGLKQKPSSVEENDWYLNTVIVRKGAFYWHNSQTQEHWELTGLDFMGFELQPHRPFQSMTSFNFASATEKAKFHVELSGDLRLSPHFTKIALSDWQGNLKATWPQTQTRPAVRLQTEGQEFVWDTQAQTYSIKNAKWFSNQGWWKTSLDYDYGDTTQGQGRFESGGVNLRHWLKQSGVPVPKFVDADVLKKIALSFRWTWNQQQWVVEDVRMVWDQSTLKGRFWTMEGDQSPVHFDLDLDRLDLDQYQAQAEASKQLSANQKSKPRPQDNAPHSTQTDPRASAALSSETKSSALLTETYLPLALPIDFLRNLRAEGSLHLGQLKAWGLRFKDIQTTLLAQSGQLDLAPLDAQLYQGQLASKLSVDVRAETPAYQWSGKVDAIDLSAFLQDGWKTAPLAGTLSSHFDLKTRGVNSDLFKQNLSGRFLGAIQEGRVKGLDLNKLLAGQPSTQKDDTQFSSMTVDGSLKQGTYDISTFVVKSQRFDASGAGRLNLPKADINAKLFAVYRQPPRNLKHLAGMEIPLSLSGPVNDIQWKVNLERLLNRPENQKKLLDTLQQFLVP